MTGLDHSRYVYRWANDKDGRVEDTKGAGWEPAPEGTPEDAGSLAAASESEHIHTRHVGGGVKAVLMRKPKEWEEEDLKPLEEKNQHIEKTIFGEVDQPYQYGKVQVGDRFSERKP